MTGASESIQLRRRLHAAPEVSGEERETAALIASILADLSPRRLETALGGHGVVAVFGRDDDADSILLRAELDALPIDERTGAAHASARRGVMHACGHDGHAAALVEVARRLSRSPPPRRVTLLFQPAEETGEGAAGVIADPRWPGLRAGRAFALHNDPGRALGEVALREGVVAAASIGLRVELLGATAHASRPERPRCAALTGARLMERAPRLPEPGRPLRMTTVTHASIGEPTFGVSPGAGVVHLSCRGESTAIRDAEARRVRDLATELAGADLDVRITEHEAFVATVNDSGACAAVREAARACGRPLAETEAPQNWSEDFGRLIDDAPGGGALFLLGAGESQAPLHDPRYDFPDELLPVAADLLERLARS